MTGACGLPRARGDRGTGLVGTAAGLLVFLVFLVFAVQLCVGLHARSAVGAVAGDAALRAATPGASRQVIADEARAALGRLGDHATVEFTTADEDGDGRHDAVVVTVAAPTPTLVPPSLTGTIGLDVVRRSARARIEELR